MTASDYTVLSAPQLHSQVYLHQAWADHAIDYVANPANPEHSYSAGLCAKIAAMVSFAAMFSLLQSKPLDRYEIIRFESWVAGSFDDCVAFVTTGIKNMFGLARSERALEGGSALVQHLLDNGFVVARIPEYWMLELQAQAGCHFMALEDQRGYRPNRREFHQLRVTTDPRDSAEMVALVNTILTEACLFDASHDDVVRHCSLINDNPRINIRSDTFWLDLFLDKEGLLPSKSAHYHHDASSGDLKALFYGSDVSKTKGPFTWAVRSNRMPILKVDDLSYDSVFAKMTGPVSEDVTVPTVSIKVFRSLRVHGRTGRKACHQLHPRLTLA